MGIVKSLFSRNGTKEDPAAEPAVATIPREPAVTKLVMLMPDASGIATYQLHTFATAAEAESYLKSILRGEIQEGTIIFWGLTRPPAADSDDAVKAEPVVLIRDPKRPGLVYTFSFVDLDSAHDFVRHEMRAGLDLAQTTIFWAAPAEATANEWGEITVTPDNPPTAAPAEDRTPSMAAPEPFAAPDHDEPNRIDPHLDVPPPVSLPELRDSARPERVAGPEPVDEPETVSKPEVTAAPAHRAIEAVDISNIINILEARGLRATSSPPQTIRQPEAPAEGGDRPDAPPQAGNGTAHDEETMHVDLSDVYGAARDRGTVTALEDFRRRREGREANGTDAAPEAQTEATAAPDDTASGIVAAWSNIAAAIDEAIDARVAQRVAATIIWRRLTRAFAAAASVRMILTWRSIAQALSDAAALRTARERAFAKAWRNGTRALHQAAESKSGLRARRLAWANISWTLEEAVYAARLSQRRAVARGWATAGAALAVAARKKDSLDRGLRIAWPRLAAAIEVAAAEHMRRAGILWAWQVVSLEMLVAADLQAEQAATREKKGRKAASGAGKAKKGAAGGKVKAKMERESRVTTKTATGRGKAKSGPKAAAKRSSADEQAAAMESWRSREARRFTDKTGPFDSFDSPPGRF